MYYYILNLNPLKIDCVKFQLCHLITIHGALYLTPVRRGELYIWFDPHNLRTPLLPPFLNLTFNTRAGSCYGPQHDQSSQITQIRQKWTLKYIIYDAHTARKNKIETLSPNHKNLTLIMYIYEVSVAWKIKIRIIFIYQIRIPRGQWFKYIQDIKQNENITQNKLKGRLKICNQGQN